MSTVNRQRLESEKEGKSPPRSLRPKMYRVSLPFYPKKVKLHRLDYRRLREYFKIVPFSGRRDCLDYNLSFENTDLLV